MKIYQILQAASGPSLYGERLVIVLGFVTLLSGIATFASCRSCLSFLSRFGLKNPMEKRWYQSFYKYHGYYWWIFLMGLFLHFLTAIMHTSIPSASDPDGQIHWIILSLGFSSALIVGGVLASCRSLSALLNLFREKDVMSNKKYLSFYRFHSYYWLILVILTAGHFASSYFHTGIWPG
jgi:hypothetical protein